MRPVFLPSIIVSAAWKCSLPDPTLLLVLSCNIDALGLSNEWALLRRVASNRESDIASVTKWITTAFIDGIPFKGLPRTGFISSECRPTSVNALHTICQMGAGKLLPLCWWLIEIRLPLNLFTRSITASRMACVARLGADAVLNHSRLTIGGEFAL